MKAQGKTFGQFLEELRAEAADAEFQFWTGLAELLKRTYPGAGISEETPVDVVADLSVKSLGRLVKLRRRKPRKPGSGRKPGFSFWDVGQAVLSLGPKAGQKQVASSLGVTPRALRNWQKKQGFSKWSDVKKHYLARRIRRLMGK